jgi:hypothetical protein
MYQWAASTLSLVPTVGFGYLSWFALLAGAVALLRATGRGRTGWEVLMVILMALVPITWMPLLDYYHPQDLLAMGLALGGLACVLRRSWTWAGILLGLAVTSQQFALLLLLPLVLVAPSKKRVALVISSACAWAIVSLSMVLVTSGNATSAVLVGTGDYSALGGTVLYEFRLPLWALHFAARAMPVLVSVGLGWWAHRRLGPRALEPVPLLSLLATCLSTRLVFEQGLYGYKFMALAVMLIVLGVVQKQVNGQLLVWLALVTVAFNPVPTGLDYNARPWADSAATAVTVSVLLLGGLVLIWCVANRRVPPWYLVVGIVIVLVAFVHVPPWAFHAHRHPVSKWIWQLILVPPGVVLAVRPLLRRARAESDPSLPVDAGSGLSLTPSLETSTV